MPLQQSSPVDAYSDADAKYALVPLVIIFILGTLCVQAFNFVFQQIGEDLNVPDQASLITAIPGIVLGIVCFVYGSLGDFVSLKKMTAIGIFLLFIGSFMGFFFHQNIWSIIVSRCFQTAGGQVAGSVYLVIAARYLRGREKVTFFGLFTAAYQFSTAIGIVASGFISMIDWSYLFLIPILSIFVLPVLAKGLPDVETTKARVDAAGFIIFGLAIGLLTLYFSYGMLFLIGSVTLFVVFAIYISSARDPFITPSFFRNTRWLRAISLILIFYAVGYLISPICNGIGKTVYGITARDVSLYLVWGNVVGFMVATSSGKVVTKLGRSRTILVASCCMVLGLASAAVLMRSGMVALTASICLFYAGTGMLYSPVTTLALEKLGPNESGRGIGMNDLAMNVTSSIGIAILGGLMSGSELAGWSIIGANGRAAVYSNLFFICASVLLLGIVVFLVFRSSLKPNEMYQDA